MCCPLCGQIHALKVHACLWRKVRSPAEAENVPIRVVSIICRAAKEAGKQYSKRILPPFVIPYCQIVRDGVAAYLRRYPDGSLVYAVGLELLGAWDRRTVRRHIGWALQLIGVACLQLAQLLSGLPAYATLPQPRLGQLIAATIAPACSRWQERGARAEPRVGMRTGGPRQEPWSEKGAWGSRWSWGSR